MNIHPISPREPVVSKGLEGSKDCEVTAQKVSRIRLPSQKTTLRGRQVSLLKEARDLSRQIKKDWNELEPEALADQIIALEDKVSLLKEVSPAVEKVRRQAELLHFKFVFPVALELDPAIPVSFAKTIYQAANRVFKTDSSAPFNELNTAQQREVMRIAGGG